MFQNGTAVRRGERLSGCTRDGRGIRAAALACASWNCEKNGRAFRGNTLMMNPLYEFGEFVRRLRAQLRFGRLSRAPLQLLRLELRGEVVECDWVARSEDAWDADAPRSVGERNASVQALEDAMAVRNLLFSILPGISSSVFRVYRQAANEPLELIIAGTVSREEQAPLKIASQAMRAKLIGFRFGMHDGVLAAFRPEEQETNF
jgi:hypothetical protein